MLLGSSPDDGVVGIAQKEANAHDREIVVHIDGVPAAVALVNFSSHHTHHTRNAGSADIDIEDSNLFQSQTLRTATWFPWAARAKASCEATVLLPTPPFPERTMRVCLIDDIL